MSCLNDLAGLRFTSCMKTKMDHFYDCLVLIKELGLSLKLDEVESMKNSSITKLAVWNNPKNKTWYNTVIETDFRSILLNSKYETY